MTDVLNELVSTKVSRSRAGLEGAYTKDLISTSAVMYSKLAMRHGFDIGVSSEYIPSEWLPVRPLPKYVPIAEWFLR